MAGKTKRDSTTGSEQPEASAKQPAKRGRPRTRRAAPGQGSVRWRDDPRAAGGGYWVGQVTIPDGTKRKRQVTGATAEEALKRLEKERAKLRGGGGLGSSRQTVEEYLENWLTEVAPKRNRPTTLVTYSNVVKLYVNPYVGAVKLEKLTPSHVRRMLQSLEKAGKSGNTQRQARAVLRRALRVAQQEGLLTINAAQLADGPSVDSAVGRTMTPEQARALLAAARGTRLEAFVALGLAVGLRPGESLALRWEDVDLEAGTVAIGGTLHRVIGKEADPDGLPALERSDPKTAKSRRVVGLIEPARSALVAQRKRQAEWQLAAGSAWRKTGYVITTEVGHPVDPRSMRRSFDRLTVKTLGESWTPHEMRHSAASLMFAEGQEMKMVSDMLGHSSTRITADVYAHLLPRTKRDALAALERVLNA